MKKITLLISLISIILTSCSEDENTTANNATYVLPIKDIYTNSSGQVYTTNHTYNGNKIVASDNGIIKFVYTYTNDLITKKEVRDSNTNYLFSYISFTYDNSQRLIQNLSIDQPLNTGVKVLYEYNTDGTVFENVYLGTATSQTNFEESSKYFLGSNGEIIKVETYTSAGMTTYNYSYDNKNNPFKNVLNLNKLRPFSNNFYNQISSTTTNPSNVIINTSTSSYTYNSDNFPVFVVATSVSNTGSTSTTSTQYFY